MPSNSFLRPVVAGVDIGGSHIGIGLLDSISGKLLKKDGSSSGDNGSSEGGTYVVHQDIDIHQDPMVIVRQISSGISQMMVEVNKSKQSYKLESVGIGCPGQSRDGILVGASNLPKFNNFPLADAIREELKLQHSLLLNDADAAMAGEFFGSSTKYANVKDACMITLGTGIGMGVIINGKLHHGSHGLIEGGHMMIPSNIRSRDVARLKYDFISNEDRGVSTMTNSRHIVCGCGQIDCVEAYASAKNTALRCYNLDNSSDDDNNNNSSCGPKYGAKEVFDRATANDKNAVETIEETCDHLAILCLNICRLIDPSVIIFGGGMSLAGASFLDKIKASMMKLTWTVLKTEVNLVLASSIADVGVYGAAMAALQSLKAASPSNAGKAYNKDSEISSCPVMSRSALLLLLGGIVGYLLGSHARRK